MNTWSKTIRTVLWALLLTVFFSVSVSAARVPTIEGPDYIFAVQGRPVKVRYTANWEVNWPRSVSPKRRRRVKVRSSAYYGPLKIKVDPGLSCQVYCDGEESGEYIFLGGPGVQCGNVVLSSSLFGNTITKEVPVYVIPSFSYMALDGGIFKLSHQRQTSGVTNPGPGYGDGLRVKIKNYSMKKIKFLDGELYYNSGKWAGSLKEVNAGSASIAPYEEKEIFYYVVRKNNAKLLPTTTTVNDFYMTCNVEMNDKTYALKILPGKTGRVSIWQGNKWVNAMLAEKPVFLHQNTKGLD